MFDKICIYYFSGTGNTEVVAELFKDEFTKTNKSVDLVKIEDVLNDRKKLYIDKYDLIGIAHPVYGFGVPGIIYKFIKLMPEANGKKVFLFKTSGDFIFLNNGASKTAIKKLRKKGVDVFHESLICMPSNWLIGYNDEVNKQLYDTAKIKVKNIAKEILEYKKRSIKANMVLRFFTLFVNTFEDKCCAKMFGRFLTANDDCTNCGKCIKDCPVSNIYKKEDKVKFKWKCIFCMRCVYACPENAIRSRGIRVFILKNGYNIRKLINNKGIKGEYITKDTKGFYKRFYDYIYPV